jgi:hypothetical protein
MLTGNWVKETMIHCSKCIGIMNGRVLLGRRSIHLCGDRIYSFGVICTVKLHNIKVLEISKVGMARYDKNSKYPKFDIVKRGKIRNHSNL